MVRRNRDSYVENLMAAPNAPPNAAEGELSSPSRTLPHTILFMQSLDLPQVLEFVGPDIIIELRKCQLALVV